MSQVSKAMKSPALQQLLTGGAAVAMGVPAESIMQGFMKFHQETAQKEQARKQQILQLFMENPKATFTAFPDEVEKNIPGASQVVDYLDKEKQHKDAVAQSESFKEHYLYPSMLQRPEQVLQEKKFAAEESARKSATGAMPPPPPGSTYLPRVNKDGTISYSAEWNPATTGVPETPTPDMFPTPVVPPVVAPGAAPLLPGAIGNGPATPGAGAGVPPEAFSSGRGGATTPTGIPDYVRIPIGLARDGKTILYKTERNFNKITTKEEREFRFKEEDSIRANRKFANEVEEQGYKKSQEKKKESEEYDANVRVMQSLRKDTVGKPEKTYSLGSKDPRREALAKLGLPPSGTVADIDRVLNNYKKTKNPKAKYPALGTKQYYDQVAGELRDTAKHFIKNGSTEDAFVKAGKAKGYPEPSLRSAYRAAKGK